MFLKTFSNELRIAVNPLKFATDNDDHVKSSIICLQKHWFKKCDIDHASIGRSIKYLVDLGSERLVQSACNKHSSCRPTRFVTKCLLEDDDELEGAL